LQARTENCFKIYTYAAEKNKIKERRDRRENNGWDGWANLWGIRRRKSVESVNWDELRSIVCVEEPSGTLHTMCIIE
jgi:hypothetical protein